MKASALLLLLASGTAFGSGLVHSWTSVVIESNNIVVRAKLTPDESRLDSFSVRVGSRWAHVPSDQLKRIDFPRLWSIEIEWACGDAKGEPGSSEFIDGCMQFISIEYDDDLSGGAGDTCQFHDDKCQRAVFTFSGGKLLEVSFPRVQRPNNSFKPKPLRGSA